MTPAVPASWLDRLRHELDARTSRIVAAQPIARAIVDSRKSSEVPMAGTAKIQNGTSRIDRILQVAEDALEGAFKRLEQATAGTVANAQAVEGVAEQVEKSNQAMADKLNQMTNGGPPLEEPSASTTQPQGGLQG